MNMIISYISSYKNHIKLIFAFLVLAIPICLLPLSVSAASVSDVYIKFAESDDYKLKKSYKVIKLNDELMVSLEDAKTLIGLEIIDGTRSRGFINENNKTISKPISVSGHSINAKLTFNLNSNEVEVSKQNKITTVKMPAENSPVSIDGVIYLPFNFIYSYNEGKSTFFDSSQNLFVYGLSRQQKSFLANFSYSKLRGCDGAKIDWYHENNYLLFEENGKYGLVKYGDENPWSKELNDEAPVAHEIVLKPEYDEIICKSDSSIYVLKQGGEYKTFNAIRSKVSNNYDSIERLKGDSGYLSSYDEEVLTAYYEDRRKDKDLGCGDIIGDFVGLVEESYLLKKNGKYGVMTTSFTSDIDYDNVEIKLYRTRYCSKTGTFSRIILYKGGETYIVDGDKIINLNDIKGKVVAIQFTKFAPIVGGVLIFVAIVFIFIFKKRKSSKTKSAKKTKNMHKANL